MNRSDFYKRVYQVVADIPKGRVTTYGAIAGYLGVRSGARMVGYALNNLIHHDDGSQYPAHRVVNRNGELTGRRWFEGDVMRERLKQEGVAFTDEYRIDIEKHFWDPAGASDTARN
jgi:methylated-DNA-protein-cysteine methyltransferase related protein